jgi:hypothetical protein
MPRLTIAATALALTLPASAIAQGDTATANLPGKFSISLGAVLGADLDTKLRFDSKSGNAGTTIDLESLLGLNSSAQSFLGTVSWRPHRRHLVTAGWYGIFRSNTRNLKRDITVGDSLWTINTKVTSTMNTAYATLGYRWSPILTRRVSAGIGLVIPVTFAEAGLEVKASGAQAQVGRKNDITVPIPLPGLHATFRLADPLYLDTRAQYLNITVFGISADVVDWAALLYYYPTRHFGFAGGVTMDNMDIGGESGNWNGKLVYDTFGATVAATYVF